MVYGIVRSPEQNYQIPKNYFCKFHLNMTLDQEHGVEILRDIKRVYRGNIIYYDEIAIIANQTKDVDGENKTEEIYYSDTRLTRESYIDRFHMNTRN